jgi:hypothetical protein
MRGTVTAVCCGYRPARAQLYFEERLINSLFVIPAKAGIQELQKHGWFAALTLRADSLSFNTQRAFVRLLPV